MCLMPSPDATVALEHDALLYAGMEEFVRGTSAFVLEGLRRDEPVMVAVPADRLPRLREALGAGADRVAFADMTVLGRNPARIIPALRAWLDQYPGRRTRFVGEPIWAGRTRDEVAEATWHESLLNLAFADTPTSILCPYDVSRLDAGALADARCTHPTPVATLTTAITFTYDPGTEVRARRDSGERALISTSRLLAPFVRFPGMRLRRRVRDHRIGGRQRAGQGVRGLCRPGRRVRAGSGGSGSHDGLSNPRPGRRRVHAGRRPGRICEITGSG